MVAGSGTRLTVLQRPTPSVSSSPATQASAPQVPEYTFNRVSKSELSQVLIRIGALIPVNVYHTPGAWIPVTQKNGTASAVASTVLPGRLWLQLIGVAPWQ